MEYEEALRYVFDQCGRGGGPEHLAEADVFRSARTKHEWSRVDRGLVKALKRLAQDAAGIPWEENDRLNGGIEPNFTTTLQRAGEILENGHDDRATREALALALLIHSMKALILKARASIPPEYRGGQ